MIEGGGSRNYIYTKKLMYRDPTAWRMPPRQARHRCSTNIAAQQVAGRRRRHPDLRQLGRRAQPQPTTATSSCLPPRALVRDVQALGVPVIYFGVDTASLLPAMRETGADVIGLDWRQPLDEGWRAARPRAAPCRAISIPSRSSPSRDLHPQARAPNPRPGRRTSRPHLQSRPRHRSRHAGRKCAGRREVGPRVHRGTPAH